MLGIKRMEVKVSFCDSSQVEKRHCYGKGRRKFETLLRAMAEHPNLKEVDFDETDFKCVHSNLLVKTLTNLEDARNVDSTKMTPQQLTDLLAATIQGQ